MVSAFCKFRRIVGNTSFFRNNLKRLLLVTKRLVTTWMPAADSIHTYCKSDYGLTTILPTCIASIDYLFFSLFQKIVGSIFVQHEVFFNSSLELPLRLDFILFYFFLHCENTPIQILKSLQPKKENVQIKKNSHIFQISIQNIDCGTR